MTDLYSYNQQSAPFSPGLGQPQETTIDRVMSVLLEIRPQSSDGHIYESGTNLADAGFTSVEMVRVMLGVEAEFDVMIPQELITPENFSTPRSIAAMIEMI